MELLQYKSEIIEEIRRGEERKRIMRQEIRQKMGSFLSYFVEGRQFLLVEVYHITRGICNHIEYNPFQVNHLHGQTEPVPRRMRATLAETEPMLFYTNYQATAC